MSTISLIGNVSLTPRSTRELYIELNQLLPLIASTLDRLQSAIST